jgi:putative aldouronate transport system substrate-binding protein
MQREGFRGAIAAPESGVSRRAFLLGASAAVGLPLLLSACTAVSSLRPPGAPTATPAASTGGTAQQRLPTYIPVQTAQPDLATDVPGLHPGYFTMPANLVQSVKDAPGSGGDVTWFGQTGAALPPPVSDNPMWQAINKALNVTST